MTLVWSLPVNGSNLPGRSSNAGLSIPMTTGGAADAVARGRCGTRLCGDWRISRWGGDRPCCGYEPVAIDVLTAHTCGPRTPAGRQSPGRPRACLSRGGLRWALEGIVVQHLTMARVAEALGVAWNTANDAVLAEGHRVLIADPTRFEQVTTIGVDEHVWRHTRKGDKYVTVIIDLTPVRNDTGPARLLDMVEGRSGDVFATWLKARPQAWRDRIEVVAMDGFTGFKTASAENLPDAIEVLDPFHVVQLAGEALDRCRQRVQQKTLGHRGRSGDPLYGIRRVLRTRQTLLTTRQRTRLAAVFGCDEHLQVEVTYFFYQQIMAAYHQPKPKAGKKLLTQLIGKIGRGVPTMLPELGKLGRTLKRRAVDILAYFDHPHTSNGPTEALNGRLEHLRGSALGFRNITHYVARSLLETGGFRPALHPGL